MNKNSKTTLKIKNTFNILKEKIEQRHYRGTTILDKTSKLNVRIINWWRKKTMTDILLKCQNRMA